MGKGLENIRVLGSRGWLVVSASTLWGTVEIGEAEFLDMNEAMSTLLWDRPGTFSWIVAGYVFTPG